MEPTDAALVQRSLSGDAEAFSTLVARHYDRVFRVAWTITGHRAEAEDLAQDICAALPGKLHSFRHEARFSTWLHRVTVNAARDRHRRQATHERAAANWGEVEQMRRAETAEAQAQLTWLQEAMGALPRDLRETAALVLGEDMTHSDAAQALGVSEGTVSWRMSEIRRRLKDMAAKEAT